MMNDNLVVNINVFTATVSSLEQVAGIEPTFSAWEADALTIVRYLYLWLSKPSQM
mgnify:FL=1